MNPCEVAPALSSVTDTTTFRSHLACHDSPFSGYDRLTERRRRRLSDKQACMMAQHTILIVDDEANQRLVLTQALKTGDEREIATAASDTEAAVAISR